MRDRGQLRAENPGIQARLAREALQDVLQTLRVHKDTPEVAAKGLVLLGVLAQVLYTRP